MDTFARDAEEILFLSSFTCVMAIGFQFLPCVNMHVRWVNSDWFVPSCETHWAKPCLRRMCGL